MNENGSLRSNLIPAAFVLAAGFLVSNAKTASYYFDVNGALPGSGVIGGTSYSWEDAVWTNDAAGNVATTNYVDGNFPRFAAGTDAIGSYTVTMNSNHTTIGMILEDGSPGSTLTINGSGTLGIDGGVSQGFIVRGGSNLKFLNPIGGTSGISFQTSGGTGNGSLYLYGNNTYSGGTALNTSGGLNFNNDNSFGTGPISWNVASQTIADPDATSPITLANAMLTRAASLLIYVGPAAAPVTFTNSWTLASGTSTLSISNTAFPYSQMTISGAIGGSGGALTKAGPGTLILSGNNSYSGATTITSGTFQVGNGGTTGSLSPASSITDNASLGFNRSNAVSQGTDFSSAAITGTGSLTQAGSGTTTLNALNSYTGSTLITAGTLSGNSLAASGSNSAFGAGSAFSISNGATLEYTGTSGSTNRTISLDTGGGTVSVPTGSALQVSGVIDGSFLTKTGGGTLMLNGINTYIGGTTINGGILVVSGASAKLGTGNITVSGTAVGSELSIETAVTNAIEDSATLSLAGGNVAGVADEGYASLSSGVNERVGSLVLGGVTQLSGRTYGSTASNAMIKNDEYFSGPGIITVDNLGDYNGDAKFDAADYVLWRKSDGTTAGYQVWRQDFGTVGAGGSSLGTDQMLVPEPSCVSVLIFGLLGLVARGCRIKNHTVLRSARWL